MRDLDIDFQLLSRECFRLVRGQSSRAWVNKNFEVKFNLCHRMESGKKTIFWEDFFLLCKIKKLPIDDKVRKMLGESVEPSKGNQVLSALKGKQKANVYSLELGVSNTRISRLLAGQTKVPLSIVLRGLHLHSYGILWFLQDICPIEEITSIQSLIEKNLIEKSLLVEHPFTNAIMQVLSFESYLKLENHSNQLIANILSLDVKVVEYVIKQLEKIGQIKLQNNRYVSKPGHFSSADQSYEDYKSIRAYWLSQSLEKLKAQTQDNRQVKASYLTFSATPDQYRQIVERYREFYLDMVKIINTPTQTPPTMSKTMVIAFNHLGGDLE